MNDHALFTRLVAEQHFLLEAFIAATTHGRGGRELVDELVQQTIAVAWRRFGSFDRASPFGPWLRGIAGRVARAHFRREARRGRIREGTAFTTGLVAELVRRFEALDPGGAGERREIVEALRSCVESLGADFSDTIRLHYRDGLATAEMASALRIDIELVRKRLQRARARIAECLERKGFRLGRGEVTA